MEMWLQVDLDGKTRLYGRYWPEEPALVQATFVSMEMAKRMFPKSAVRLVL